jgi:uncharacterized protein
LIRPSPVARACLSLFAALAACCLAGWPSASRAQSDPAGAVRLLDRWCTAGQADSCTRLAILLSPGGGLPQDVPRTVAVLERGCALEAAEACYRLAIIREESEPPLRDMREAAVLFERGCSLHHGASCAAAGDFLARGSAGNVDRRAADARRREACDLGTSFSCFAIGEGNSRAEALARESRLLERLWTSCQGNEIAACLSLATRGPVPPASDGADRFSQARAKACDLGALASCETRSQLLAAEGIAPDAPPASLELLQRACESGTGALCLPLALLATDPADRAQRVRLGCDTGSAQACLLLPVTPETASDRIGAVTLLAEDCDRRDLPACLVLAHAYRDGLGGLSRSPERTALLLQRACEPGPWTPSCRMPQ